MKIQCDVCEGAEAAVLCCADEAALCWRCDEQVHAANKLAGKHQRVPLLPSSSPSGSSQVPTCDICQEKAGYFFCLEDRALLCRNCDVSVHTASPYVSSHQRFLITGVRVALHHYLNKSNNDNSSSNKSNNDNSSSNNIDISNNSSNNGNNSNPLSSLASIDSVMDKKLRAGTTADAAGEMEGFRMPWNELFDVTEFDRCYGLSELGYAG